MVKEARKIKSKKIGKRYTQLMLAKDIIKQSNVPYDNFTRISCEEICCDCQLEQDSLDIKEAMNSILSQSGLMLNGQLLSTESKIALSNAIKLGLEYADQLQNKEKFTNK